VRRGEQRGRAWHADEPALPHASGAARRDSLGEKRGEPEYPEEFARVITECGARIVETCGGSVALMHRLHAALRAGGVRTIISKCKSSTQWWRRTSLAPT
jgi:hypothetical protein